MLRLVEESAGEWSRPNFIFAAALAKHLLEKDGDLPEGSPLSDTSSTELLCQAISTYPVALTRLLEKLKDKGMVTMTAWEAVLQEPLFRKASTGKSASLNHLVTLFVERQ